MAAASHTPHTLTLVWNRLGLVLAFVLAFVLASLRALLGYSYGTSGRCLHTLVHAYILCGGPPPKPSHRTTPAFLAFLSIGYARHRLLVLILAGALVA